MLQQIIDDNEEPAPGEEQVAALTAGDRIPWAKARHKYFSKGLNKASLDAIEQVRFDASCCLRYDSISPSTSSIIVVLFFRALLFSFLKMMTLNSTLYVFTAHFKICLRSQQSGTSL